MSNKIKAWAIASKKNAWAIASKKNLGYYYPASFKIEQKKSIYEWFAIGIMWEKLEAKEYLAFLKRHGLNKSFKVIPCKITFNP